MNLKNTMHWINQKEIQAHLTELKRCPPMTREQEEVVLKRIAAGDMSGKSELIRANLRFVITVAKRYQNQGIPLSDLVSEGNFGLVVAADKYDYNKRQVRFLSYAVWWVKQSITSCLHENSRTVRLPANLIGEICKASREPMGETVYDYTLAFPKMMSFDIPMDDEGNTLYELIRDEDVHSPDHVLDNPTANINKSLGRIMGLLKNTEKFVVVKAYGLDGDEWTLQDIADRMHLTKERVRQIKEKAIKKLRANSPQLLQLVG